MPDSISPIGVPIGTVIPYAADPVNLPPNWHVCDGTSYSEAQYRALYDILGASSDPFNIPDLRGRFIRGSNDKVGGGTLQSTSTTAQPDPKIQCTVTMMATGFNWANKGGTLDIVSYKDKNSWFACSGGDKETRPINTYFHYIIKIAKSSTVTGDDIPLAGMVPFGSVAASRFQNFPEYLRCDGSKADVSSIGPALNKLLDDKFTATPQPGQVVAPDLTGRFIRGVDPTASIDPDGASRNPAPNGTQGVGTWQPYGTAFKSPGLTIPHYSTDTNSGTGADGHINLDDTGYVNSQTWNTAVTAKETRPVNAAIYHYIHTVDPAATKNPLVFPIGGVIAIPGSSALPETSGGSWHTCDGSALKTASYPDLFNTIGFTWGETSDGLFQLPNLSDMFLRGPDLDGKTPYGDPDWNARTNSSSNSSPKPLIGPGSYQKAATAMSQNKLSFSNTYPSHSKHQGKAIGHPESFYDKNAAASGAQTYDLSATWDTETAPVNYRVAFYIRTL